MSPVYRSSTRTFFSARACTRYLLVSALCRDVRRRDLLGLLGAGPFALGGCLESGDGERAGVPTDRAPAEAKGTDSPESADETTPPERPASSRPAGCPVTTVSDIAPPGRPTPKTVELFVRRYEEAYMLQEQFLSYEDELTEATILSLERTGYGYAVRAQFSGVDTYLRASVRAQPVETAGATAPLTAVDSERLRAAARRAADRGRGVVDQLATPRAATAAQSRPAQLIGSATLDELPGGSAGAYVTVEDTPVRLRVEVQEVHADYFIYAVLYYVDGRVVRRNYLPQEGADPRAGPLVECR